MLAAEAVCREEGWTAIGLNVFGPNTRARGLYDSLGYEAVSTSMTKPLTD
jgi:ribosomal protein S18 acetylase RimI-like enzyme